MGYFKLSQLVNNKPEQGAKEFLISKNICVFLRDLIVVRPGIREASTDMIVLIRMTLKCWNSNSSGNALGNSHVYLQEMEKYWVL